MSDSVPGLYRASSSFTKLLLDNASPPDSHIKAPDPTKYPFLDKPTRAWDWSASALHCYLVASHSQTPTSVPLLCVDSISVTGS